MNMPEMNQKDYYKIIGVSESAGPDEIKKSYRNLAFRYHPDRSTGHEEMMKEINEAYAVLSNPVKRDEYDALRQRYGSFARDQFRQTHTDQDIFRDADIGQIFEELSKVFGFSRAEDIFSRDNFYGTSYRTFEFKGKGGSGRGFFFYGPMRQAYRYGMKSSPDQTRQLPEGRPPLLSILMGKVASLLQRLVAKELGLELPKDGKDLYDFMRITPEEASAGGKVRYLYEKSGKPRNLLVTLPQGIKNGQRIKLKGLGEEGKYGGKPGDLHLKVKIRGYFLERIKLFLNKQ
ncbi:MAG: J domain-containing protein [Nitrospirae bacterium]|nr:J domain-containing protein [Nitrospirota bacterium]